MRTHLKSVRKNRKSCVNSKSIHGDAMETFPHFDGDTGGDIASKYGHTMGTLLIFSCTHDFVRRCRTPQPSWGQKSLMLFGLFNFLALKKTIGSEGFSFLAGICKIKSTLQEDAPTPKYSSIFSKSPFEMSL